jgi:DNA ligase-1
MEPMKAGTAEFKTLDSIRYPVYVSPKIDGWRCTMHKGRAMSRKWLRIPNKFVQHQLENLPSGLDGELVVGDCTGKKAWNKSQSGLSRAEGNPKFKFMVFDWVKEGTFAERFADVRQFMLRNATAFVEYVPHKLVKNEAELLALEKKWVAEGYEGIMIRSQTGPYKHGRSTVREGYLLKLKRWYDVEGVVTGVEEEMHNSNEDVKNAFGRAKRSKKKDGMIGKGVAGALICNVVINGKMISVSVAGMTAAQKKRYFKKPPKIVTIKYSGITSGGKLRNPSIKGERHD